MAINIDDLDIEILEDGTIKTSSGKVSAANHSNAEEFLRYIARLTGGETARTRRKENKVAQNTGHQTKQG